MQPKDFIYFDASRMESFVAQLHGGLAKEIQDIAGTDRVAHGKLSIQLPWLFGTEVGGKRMLSTEHRVTRVLHDYLYTLLEEGLSGRLRDINAEFAYEDWIEGKVHIELSKSQMDFIKLVGRVKITDFISLAESLESALKVVETFSRLQTPPVQMHKKKGGIEGAKELTGIVKTIRELYKGVIIAKVFPLVEKDEYYFVGGLDGECLQDDRNRMLLKFGVAPTAKWTVLGQVASVPQPTLPSQEIPDFSSISSTEGTMADVLEQVLDTFNSLLTQTGMAISVRHPAIAITPLAIFRG